MSWRVYGMWPQGWLTWRGEESCGLLLLLLVLLLPQQYAKAFIQRPHSESQSCPICPHPLLLSTVWQHAGQRRHRADLPLVLSHVVVKTVDRVRTCSKTEEVFGLSVMLTLSGCPASQKESSHWTKWSSLRRVYESEPMNFFLNQYNKPGLLQTGVNTHPNWTQKLGFHFSGLSQCEWNVNQVHHMIQFWSTTWSSPSAPNGFYGWTDYFRTGKSF